VAATLVIVITEVSVAILGQDLLELRLRSADWWALLGTFGLIGAFLGAKAIDSESWGRAVPEFTAVSFHWLGITIMWWLGVSSSPLVSARMLVSADYLPLATAVAALATAQLLRRYRHGENRFELAWLGTVRSERLRNILSVQAFVLAAVAVLFTKGAVEPKTVLTLALSSIALGSLALALASEPAAAVASLVWAATGGMAGLVIANRQGWFAFELRTTSAAVGLIVSAFSLWAIAGWLRRDFTRIGVRDKDDSNVPERSWVPIALVAEWVAFGSALVSNALVLTAAASPAIIASGGTYVGVGVFVATAMLSVALVPRWQSEWLVYFAQVVLLGSYVDYRMAFALPITTDAVVLTAFAFLDLAIAEVMQWLRATRYVRPIRNFSLVLPLLPLVEFLRIQGLDELSVFHLGAAAGFYAVAGARLQWKALGYGAAVLLNAALWVLWSRIGWRLTDHPQFFMTPVGLSAILFAEVDRRALGRESINTIRSVGLLIIYVSLAVPIWQFQSFGAWVTFLICSLVSIFVGIGLRLQTFLWMGVTSFVLNLVYEMARVSADYAVAKWLIMLAIGISIVLFVALNEKKQIVGMLQDYYKHVRQWE
jgi:hypothetical protein